MAESKTDVLILMLIGIAILLMVAIIGLFIRMNQLQSEVLAALEPLQAMRVPQGLEIGAKAPDFTLPDVEGRMVSLKDFVGRKVLLEFSSTRCPACKELYPDLKAFSEQSRDVQLVMICEGSADEVRRLAGEFGLPVLMWEDSVTRDYRVPGVPFFYVIDDEGVVINKGFANSLEQLKELVRAGK